ncbi:DUF1479-domain-containing protein [Crepidotus variabilis]|uniref:DUF1479-domain-containing protein n=1 Tax=Crepidotus variabilis TaxID=179855 RepID=A0A9P6JLX6_9AGAR|nr:DUF1479-domain-containing protein [Crepidotus variabilis]
MSSGTISDTLPARFADLKREIAASYPSFEENVTRTWKEVIDQLKLVNAEIAKEGTNYIPQVSFRDLDKLSEEEIERIKRRGCIVIRDVVSDEEAIKWRQDLQEFVAVNPDVDGNPIDDKQFFMLYWTKPQVLARAHPNVLAASVWLNNLYHCAKGDQADAATHVDLSSPLTYADRFRIRKPGSHWKAFPPHLDGGSIERWEEPNFRQCFSAIFSGNWQKFDAYDIGGRVRSKHSLYGRPNQSTVFRTFQGWMSVSETAPGEGTLQVFPDVLLSDAYIMLRPFFRPILSIGSEGFYEAKNWEFDLVTSVFPGIFPDAKGGFSGPRMSLATHPHLELDRTMTSVPKVFPGDMVFWHGDVVHAVEEYHKGLGPSAVMFIPAVPSTAQNIAYVEKQKEAFLKGRTPPDFPQNLKDGWVGIGKADDITNPMGRRAMGL